MSLGITAEHRLTIGKQPRCGMPQILTSLPIYSGLKCALIGQIHLRGGGQTHTEQ